MNRLFVGTLIEELSNMVIPESPAANIPIKSNEKIIGVATDYQKKLLSLRSKKEKEFEKLSKIKSKKSKIAKEILHTELEILCSLFDLSMNKEFPNYSNIFVDDVWRIISVTTECKSYSSEIMGGVTIHINNGWGL